MAGGRPFHEFGSLHHKQNLGCPIPSAGGVKASLLLTGDSSAFALIR